MTRGRWQQLWWLQNDPACGFASSPPFSLVAQHHSALELSVFQSPRGGQGHPVALRAPKGFTAASKGGSLFLHLGEPLVEQGEQDKVLSLGSLPNAAEC